MLTTVFVLLLVFQLKHFLADYPLQTPYMLGKFKDEGWEVPLAAHCGVHAAFTFVISTVTLLVLGRAVIPSLILGLLLSALDFSLHFIMDRIKAGKKYLGRYKALSADEYRQVATTLGKYTNLKTEPHPEIKNAVKSFQARLQSNVYFWWALGLDQGVHHLTHYLIIYLLVTA